MAVVRAFVESGATCVALGRSSERAAAMLASVDHDRVSAIVADVTDQAQCDAAISESTRRLGGLDVLVNCAGRVSGTTPDGPMTADLTDIAADFDAKVLGVLRCVRSARGALASSGSGRIVNVGGDGARVAGNVSSGARNAALVHLTRTLALELGPDGITVNVVQPGATLTDTVRQRLQAAAVGRGEQEDAVIERLAARNAIRRFVEPADVANVVAFFASIGSAGVTGEAISVTGGSSAAVHY
jgi:NAD(P)-dependent dehydrogenase (short-subunit alcohol dehydrogenase family)